MGSQQEHNAPSEDELHRRRIAHQRAELRKEATKAVIPLDTAMEAILGCTPQLFDSLTLENLVRIRNQSKRVYELFDDILSDK